MCLSVVYTCVQYKEESILLYHGYRVFPGVKAAGGVVLTTHPPLVYRGSRKRVELYRYSP